MVREACVMNGAVFFLLGMNLQTLIWGDSIREAKMIFGKTRMELKVGIFVFCGIIALSAFVLVIGKFNTWSTGYRINFIFGFVNGVKVGAPVRFAGVDVGEVKSVQIFLDNKDAQSKVKVGAWVRNEVKIPVDSTVWVNTLGLMGERYVEVMPGSNHSVCLKENGVLVGTDPIAMHEVAQLAKDITLNLDESITRLQNGEGTVGKLLYDDAVYNQIRAIMQEFELFVADIRKHPWKLFWKGKEKK